MFLPTSAFAANPYRSTDSLQRVMIASRSVVKTASCNWSRMPGGMPGESMASRAGAAAWQAPLTFADFGALSVGVVFDEIDISRRWLKGECQFVLRLPGRSTNFRYRPQAKIGR